MPWNKTLLITLCLYCLCFQVKSIDLSKLDFSQNYKKNGVRLNYSLSQSDTTYRLLLSIDYTRYSSTDQIENLTLLSQEKFSSSKDQKVTPSYQNTKRLVPGEHFEFRFSVPNEHNYLVIQFNYQNTTYYYDIAVNESLAFPLATFSCMRLEDSAIGPLFYLGDSVHLSSLGVVDQTYYLYQYTTPFKHALPPMVTSNFDTTNQILDIQKSAIPQNAFKLDTIKSLYFIQTDTTTNTGTMCMSQSSSYPKLTQIEEVIAPLVYISTSEEYQTMLEAEDPKAAFEDFWLKIIPAKNMAAGTIKAFYRNVQDANELFTSYKEGWKMDRGMIYLIFGPPERVEREEDKEIWKYSRYEGEIKFTFVKQINLFTQFHYVLEREKSYSGIWFSEIKKWRQGNI
ncbi:GWxTD domain-containing protein [Reichenbachiella agariperforans]|uniref:GWxTD domain-containing protein n=1 Tax=Reichenbachiella agariperforans TaxID=156994 RepID=A0A1M6NLP5_REIAG|nr:GWxTD domain-containing protein [Reichenbachiella agariperforans]SHJ96524.1 GWxTD domain-containing protein [Reichenbachiella agariperforans]